jgi:sialidase-1
MTTHRCAALALAAALLPAPACAAEPAAPPPPEAVDVFVQGTEGFHTFRIPSVVRTNAGTLLAFAEGRASRADQSENKLVLKRSDDGGRTWSPLQVALADGARCLNNPCAVVERKSGRVLLMIQSYPPKAREHSKDLKPGYDGESIVRSLLIRSDDDGRTWSAPVDVTRACKRPDTATTVAGGPGIGIQLRRGPHAGRLVVPFNEGPPGRWNVYAVFSDDGGTTWARGEAAPDAQGPKGSLVNECQVAERGDGSVLLNSRRAGGGMCRKTCVSRDGGRTWSDVAEAPDLPDPACMAGLLAMDGRLFHSGPFSDKRRNGTVAASADDGTTWPARRTIWPGLFAYSCLVDLPGGRIGCLFETGVKDPYERIAFLTFDAAAVSASDAAGASK